MASSSSSRTALTWAPTRRLMNVGDLSRDDDFLSGLLVEKLGTEGVPLLVHKMDGSRRFPRVDAQDLFAIVRRVRVFHSLLASGAKSFSVRSRSGVGGGDSAR